MGIVLGCACAHTHTDTRACSVASPKRKSHVSKPRCLQLCKAAQREEWVAGVKAEAGRGAQAGLNVLKGEACREKGRCLRLPHYQEGRSCTPTRADQAQENARQTVLGAQAGVGALHTGVP